MFSHVKCFQQIVSGLIYIFILFFSYFSIVLKLVLYPHGGYPVNRNVRHGSHNMADAQGAKTDMSSSPLKRLSTKWFKYT